MQGSYQRLEGTCHNDSGANLQKLPQGKYLTSTEITKMDGNKLNMFESGVPNDTGKKSLVTFGES